MGAALVSLLTKDTETFFPYFCTMCKNTHTETEAKAYCKECDSLFCDECVKLHSQLFQSHTSNGREDMEKWPVSMATQEFLENCKVHNGKKLKLFCEDHSQLCCNTCIRLSHRQCSKVNLIADTTLSAKDHQQLSVKINSILDQLMKLQTNWESNIKSLQVSYEERLNEVRSMRERINATLDKLEKVTLKELDELKASWNVSLKFDVDTCSRLRNELTRLSDAMLEIGKKNEELAFIGLAHQKSEEMIKQVDTYLKNNSIQTEVSLKRIDYNGPGIEWYLSSAVGLVNTIHISKELTMQGSPDQAFTVTGATPVSVRINSDTSDCCITGICGLFNGQLVVTDNERLKLLDLQYKVISDCHMPDLIWDMCLITSCQVAVAVNKHIKFVSVNNGQLVIDRELQLSHECRGVAYNQGELYVTSGNALYKYTIVGTLVNYKMFEDTSSYMAVCKCAVSPSGDKIYVTNNSQNKLLTLARKGTVISTFTDTELQGPRGVNVTPAGQVLVCGNLSHTVIQVDREGKNIISMMKDGLQSPRSVFYNWKTGSVIVGQSNKDIVVLKLE